VPWHGHNRSGIKCVEGDKVMKGESELARGISGPLIKSPAESLSQNTQQEESSVKGEDL